MEGLRITVSICFFRRDNCIFSGVVNFFEGEAMSANVHESSLSYEDQTDLEPTGDVNNI
jgi:hypothetical protein